MGKSHSHRVKKVIITDTEYGVVVYGSQTEADEGEGLKLLAKAGKIKGLGFHYTFKCMVNGVLVGKYTPDYCYHAPGPDGMWRPTAHEHKGRKTDVYRLRVKLFQACFPNIVFKESGAATIRKTRRRKK